MQVRPGMVIYLSLGVQSLTVHATVWPVSHGIVACGSFHIIPQG